MQCSMRQHNYLGTSMTGRSKQGQAQHGLFFDSNFLTPRDSLLTSATRLSRDAHGRESMRFETTQYFEQSAACPCNIEVVKTHMWEKGK